MVTSCQEFKDKREYIDIRQSSEHSRWNDTEEQELPRDLEKAVCVYQSHSRGKTEARPLRDYFPEKRKIKKKKRGKAVAKESTRG